MSVWLAWLVVCTIVLVLGSVLRLGSHRWRAGGSLPAALKPASIVAAAAPAHAGRSAWGYPLESHLHELMLQSPHRTLNPEVCTPWVRHPCRGAPVGCLASRGSLDFECTRTELSHPVGRVCVCVSAAGGGLLLRPCVCGVHDGGSGRLGRCTLVARVQVCVTVYTTWCKRAVACMHMTQQQPRQKERSAAHALPEMACAVCGFPECLSAIALCQSRHVTLLLRRSFTTAAAVSVSSKSYVKQGVLMYQDALNWVRNTHPYVRVPTPTPPWA